MHGVEIKNLARGSGSLEFSTGHCWSCVSFFIPLGIFLAGNGPLHMRKDHYNISSNINFDKSMLFDTLPRITLRHVVNYSLRDNNIPKKNFKENINW